MNLENISLSGLNLVFLITLFLLSLVVLFYKLKIVSKDNEFFKEEAEQACLSLVELNEKLEIQSNNEVILSSEIYELNQEIDRVRSNCFDFENEMGNAQLEVIQLNKTIASQKAHHGKQKKKIEAQDKTIHQIDNELYRLQCLINGMVKAGYAFINNQYYKAVKITAPTQKKQAQQALDNLNK